MCTQSEALGYELAKFLESPSPNARLLRISDKRWTLIRHGVESLNECNKTNEDDFDSKDIQSFATAMDLNKCLLLIPLVNGPSLVQAKDDAFVDSVTASDSGESLGRLFFLVSQTLSNIFYSFDLFNLWDRRI